MNEVWPHIVSALLLGLLGGGHCLGMCGGLMGALTMAIPEDCRQRRYMLLLACNVGRITSYGVAGALFGMFGWALAATPLLFGLRVLAALLLIAMGLYLADIWRGLTRIEALGRAVWRRLQPYSRRLMPVTDWRRAFLLGAVWGWLPCGLVYSVLIWAASQGDPAHSAMLMVFFGLGTWPILLATGLAATPMLDFLRRRHVRIASGVLIIMFGLWTCPGPHQQWLMTHLWPAMPGNMHMHHAMHSPT